jgi:hypothetical protein
MGNRALPRSNQDQNYIIEFEASDKKASMSMQALEQSAHSRRIYSSQSRSMIRNSTEIFKAANHEAD